MNTRLLLVPLPIAGKRQGVGAETTVVVRRLFKDHHFGKRAGC